MGILFLSEVNYYLTPTMSEELFVDTSRGSKLRINLDIIVPAISCDRKYKLYQYVGEEKSDLVILVFCSFIHRRYGHDGRTAFAHRTQYF